VHDDPERMRVIVWHNQGLLGIAFFEATTSFIFLVLFFYLQRDYRLAYLRTWLAGWVVLTVTGFAGLASLVYSGGLPFLRIITVTGEIAAFLLFLAGVTQLISGSAPARWPLIPLACLAILGDLYLEAKVPAQFGKLRWETAALESFLAIAAGWVLWRSTVATRGVSAKFLAGAFFLIGLHGLDRPVWPENPLYLVRLAFGDLLFVVLGIGMIVFVLEGARARAEELNDKLRRLTLLTTESTQTFSVKEVLDKVLVSLVESLAATHGAVRLLEGSGGSAELVLKSSVGFTPAINEKYARLPVREPWVQRVLSVGFEAHTLDDETDERTRNRMIEDGITQLVTVPLPGKNGPQGLLLLGSSHPVKFPQDQISFLGNVANLLGLTLLNVHLFEQVATAQEQWTYTFDSIGDPVLVHDPEYLIVRSNQRLSQILGRHPSAMYGRSIGEVFPRRAGNYDQCPYCEGSAGGGDNPDPWLGGYFLASNSTFSDPQGRQLGTVHVLKDITDRKRAEEKYRSLISNVQEGVFISTPQGRFIDFNDALMRMAGYESREELMGANIPSLYAIPADRERLKKLLHEHGSVSDFEFEWLRKDGEVRTVLESSIGIRDAGGEVTAYQGFLLDITERKRAEQEIRRRNRELMVLNSIGQTLNESLDLKDSVRRTLHQLVELFQLDASSLYLLDEKQTMLQCVAAVGQQSGHSRVHSSIPVQPDLLQHVRAVRATFLSTSGLPLPPAFREAQSEDGIVTAYVVVLWSKDRVIGGLFVGSRSPREFSPADVNLLIAVGVQISSAIERSLLFEETRQAYENLRRTQEQLLHSEKMAAIGQLISGVAHELNNPLTAILGYSQLLSANGQIGPQAVEYSEKLYKQAQRTHRIVQNLLSFARQRKPERVPVAINQVIVDTLALRDYDLRLSNIRLNLDLAPDLPVTEADPHQLQQVFLNLVNNAVDAILEHSREGQIWVRTASEADYLIIEFADSGPGVQDPARVFDPFYTTKPVGKGTGLGLSICYGIVMEHGGTIQVRNAPPRGATFTIAFPWQRKAEIEQPAGGEAAPVGKRRRILLIDDDDSVLEAVSETLRASKHFVQTAQTADRAKECLMAEDFDLILAGTHLPGRREGENLLHWLAVTKPDLVGRVVLMSSGTGPAEAVRPEPFSSSRVLQKPFKTAELIATLEETLKRVRVSSISD
jgi:PAS domain S-box-containing protein